MPLGETKTTDVAMEQAQNVPKATEHSAKTEDRDVSLSLLSGGRALEEVNTENDQLVRQLRPKEATGSVVRTLSSTFRLWERPLEKGKERVRWRCACGRHMYDDFTEVRTGAAAELEKWLNNTIKNHPVSTHSNPTQGSVPESVTSPSEVNAGHQQTAASDISLQRRIDALPELRGNTAISLEVHLEKCWLLVYGQLQRGPNSLLTHLDLSHTPSDKNLFTEMREIYSNLRNGWGLRSFLRGVKTTRFVQVSLSACDRKGFLEAELTDDVV